MICGGCMTEDICKRVGCVVDLSQGSRMDLVQEGLLELYMDPDTTMEDWRSVAFEFDLAEAINRLSHKHKRLPPDVVSSLRRYAMALEVVNAKGLTPQHRAS